MPVYDKYLEDLENRINPEVEDALLLEWENFLDGNLSHGYFSPTRIKQNPPTVTWPTVTVNETLENEDAMVIQQYQNCSNILEKGIGETLSVRSNFGTGIMPSLFGAELFIMDESANTLPMTRTIEGGHAAIRRLIRNGIPDLENGLGEKVFSMGQKFVEISKQYPLIGKYISIYHPDMQGPMDIAELLWGSSLLLDILDDPELVHEFLDLITETYIAFMLRWRDIVGDNSASDKSVHWGFMHKGKIMLRDDSAMNLSPEMFDEFIKPRNQRLLRELGGGCMHFCGRGDHFVPLAVEMDGLYAINVSQPEYNDMEIIYRNTVDKGIFILGLNKKDADAAIAMGRELHGKVYRYFL